MRTLILAAVLGGAAAAGIAGCDFSGPSEAGAGIIAAEPASLAPRIAGVRRYLFTITRTASAVEVESFFVREVIPALSRDPRVGDIVTFVDEATATYGVQLDLKTDDLPRLSLALDILSVGRSHEEAERLLEQAGKYFDLRSARQLAVRGDLSISRSTLGTLEPESRR